MEKKRRIRNTVGKYCWEGRKGTRKKGKLLERKEGKKEEEKIIKRK